MNLITLIILSLGLMFLAHLKKSVNLAIVSASAWVLVGGYAYTLGGTTTIYYAVFFVCIGLAFATGVDALSMREKSPIDNSEEAQAKG